MISDRLPRVAVILSVTAAAALLARVGYLLGARVTTMALTTPRRPNRRNRR
ncbi:hypothetical protein [Actinokineospora sp. HUAS TT18]|uniref:hypothetical protein n=1 Tax=Actinokineospora sp. HUAS TT18 TaxID=3447451 RepID=UPI003F52182B